MMEDLQMSNIVDSFKSTKKVLEKIGLVQDEINTYFNITGRSPVMVGEIALLSDVSEERAAEIAKNLLEKGLVREIPGKTPHYLALPPYAALLNQIHSFKETVKDIQKVTPEKLQYRFRSLESQSAKLKKFEDYRKYIQEMQKKLPAQIKQQFNKFETELDQIKKFREVKSFILNMKENVPTEITGEFQHMESQFSSIKSEISDAFEKQFRIGALKTMAEKIVSRIVTKQFEELTTVFRDKFIETTESMLDQVISQLGMISDTAGEISTDLGSAFSDVESGLTSTLYDLESRISGVHEDIVLGMEELKKLFQKEILDTLRKDVMNEIINQLEISEETMNEFWERSKQASMLSFKNVWWIMSPEAMIAQINESISRVKMKFFIIAPTLQDIDIVALTSVKPYINVRISADYNPSDPKDQEILREIAKHTNFSFRHYPRQNLWAINKDFEEMVLCVISKGEDGSTEIAGMGSILEEHIKLFATVTEDVWIQSKKL